jgi:hypothetical protein
MPACIVESLTVEGTIGAGMCERPFQTLDRKRFDLVAAGSFDRAEAAGRRCEGFLRAEVSICLSTCCPPITQLGRM